MSLRARLLAILALAAVTLVAAASAVWYVVEASDGARIASAQASADAAAEALADAWARHPDDRDAREQEARAVIAALVDGMGGYCGPGAGQDTWAPTRGEGRRRYPGTAGGARGVPGHGPPEVARALRRVCDDGQSMRMELPDAMLLVGAQRIDDGKVAWATRRVTIPRDDATRRWRASVVVLSLSSAALVTILIGALFALRRGVRQLQDGVMALEGDLRRAVPRPVMAELAEIGEAVVGLARRLADAGDRERTLSHDLAHRERLASLGRVVGGVAHEIRNPLAGLKLKLDLLARDPALGPDAKADIATCLGEVGRLDRVVASLLVATRRDDGPRVRVDLRRLSEERAELLTPLTAPRAVTISVDGEAIATASLHGMTRVLDNLLRNAVEASPRGGEVRVTLVDAPEVVLSVTDAGRGPSEADAERLFEPFFTTKPDGTGLGLFLTRALVLEEGGEVTFAREGAMSVFRVTLPREARSS